MWQIEHQCPQCGATTNIEETVRLFSCPYCRGRLYIASNDYQRHFLPSTEEDTIFIPYWRFKGMFFSFASGSVKHGLIDISRNASRIEQLPNSLGLRTQTQKLKFISIETKGRFLKPIRTLQDILYVNNPLIQNNSSFLERKTYIGESAGLIYSPIYLKNRTAYDGILKKKIFSLTDECLPELTGSDNHPSTGTTFIPSLCPNCGWDLNGESDSIVMTCNNCNAAWCIMGNRFVNIACGYIPLRDQNLLYLPFWKIEAKVDGMTLKCPEDFIRLCNLPPRLLAVESHDQPFYMLTPAFKIRPAIYLNLSRSMTLAPLAPIVKDALPKEPIYPVTLPLMDSFESLKILIAYCSPSKEEISLRFHDLRFELIRAELIYWPFYPSNMELIRSDRQFSISSGALKWGNRL
jgi:DNA-directed RNA polymerase subunit RPC12/RpoP/predicted nucleic-acid-binding Zn-ribbon protein